MAREDYLIRLSLLEQEANKNQEQIEVVSQQISELESLKLSLDKLGKNKNKEVLAPLGRGIFFKAEKKEKKLWVNVGSNVVLKKSSEETKEIIDKQISQLEEIRKDLSGKINNINSQLQELVIKAQKEKK